MENTNEMTIIFDSYSSNEAFARVAVAAFMTSLNPTVEEVADVKTAVSEAVTNAIIHGYENFAGYTRAGGGKGAECRKRNPGKVFLKCLLEKEMLHIEIRDEGRGIADVEQAMDTIQIVRGNPLLKRGERRDIEFGRERGDSAAEIFV